MRSTFTKTSNFIINKRFFTDKNVLSLYNRGFFQEIFPDNAGYDCFYKLKYGAKSQNPIILCFLDLR